MSDEQPLELQVSCSADRMPNDTFQIIMMISNVPTQQAAQAIVDNLRQPLKQALLATFETAEIRNERTGIDGGGRQ